MASAPPAPNLPLFYNDLMPLNSRDHANWHARATDKAGWFKNTHAIPLTAEEFPSAQRFTPIVFSAEENPVPLALFGLNEGVNVYVDDEGKLTGPVYVPAYVRRYPWLLAKLSPDSEELSLCFDPTTDLVGEFDEGDALFDGDQPSEACQNALNFCRTFEEAGIKTQSFVEELIKHELLMDGELSIARPDKPEEPFIYRGFKMVDQEKLSAVRGDVLRMWNQNGLLSLVYAHLFSLDLTREIFGLQMAQGKGPQTGTSAA